MQVEIDLFDDEQSGSNEHSSILHELTKRRAMILSAQADDLASKYLFFEFLMHFDVV